MTGLSVRVDPFLNMFLLTTQLPTENLDTCHLSRFGIVSTRSFSDRGFVHAFLGSTERLLFSSMSKSSPTMKRLLQDQPGSGKKLVPLLLKLSYLFKGFWVFALGLCIASSARTELFETIRTMRSLARSHFLYSILRFRTCDIVISRGSSTKKHSSQFGSEGTPYC